MASPQQTNTARQGLSEPARVPGKAALQLLTILSGCGSSRVQQAIGGASRLLFVVIQIYERTLHVRKLHASIGLPDADAQSAHIDHQKRSI